MRGSRCKFGCRSLRPLDAAAARENLMESQDFARQAALTRPHQEPANPGSINLIGVSERVRKHNCPFSLPQIAIDLLAVTPNVAN